MSFIWNNAPKEKRNLNHYKKNTVKKLFSIAKPYKNRIILVFICIIIVILAQLVKPYILKLVIDDFLVKRLPQEGFYSIKWMAMIYFIVVVLGGIFSILQINIVNKIGQEIITTLRSKVFKTIQLLSLSYLDKTSSGKLITRSTNDLEALSQLYTDVLTGLFKDIFLLIGIIYAMVMLNIQLTLLSFACIPIIIITVVTLKGKIKSNFKNLKRVIGKLNSFMAENISGMKIIQIFNGQDEKKREFLKLNDEFFRITKFQIKIQGFLRPISNFIESLAVALIIWYGMGKIANNQLQIGVLYAFTTYIKQFFVPISDLADKYTVIQSALVSADRVFELLEEEEELENLEEGIKPEKIQGDIEFRNVWFSYNNEDWVLKDISFTLKKGETGAFVGETGAGKSTIISLISGFYYVQKGEILIDGVNINEISKKELRKNICIVLQDVFLFSGTIRKNIALNDDIPDDKIKESVKLACADNFINKLKNGINHVVIEKGGNFSSGEKQLIAFARAIAHDPSIFVLDEATANIDTHTELLIQNAIKNITKDRTTIIIAHRLSTIRNADKIFVLNNGKLVECGSHRELISKDGYYKRMQNDSV